VDQSALFYEGIYDAIEKQIAQSGKPKVEILTVAGRIEIEAA